jgi:cathepsin X
VLFLGVSLVLCSCITTPDHPKGPHCFPVKTVVRYRAKEYGHVAGEHAMMKELLNGPITCGIACSDEFTFNYSASVFRDDTGFLYIVHDVEVVGWGEEADGTKYWRIRNSWGCHIGA